MTLTPVPTTLVVGTGAGERETAIAAAIARAPLQKNTAVILEGMPDGIDHFATADNVFIARIAPGCPCCIGNLTMRVTLNRVLRRPPAQLYIGLATSAHLEQVRIFLTQAPYAGLLALTADIQAFNSIGAI